MAARIDPATPLRDEMNRIAGDALSAIGEHLRLAADNHAAGLHQARKAIKRLRAFTRLTRAAAPGPLREAERLLRDGARAIAAPREATAAVETLERFIRDYPDRIVDCHLGEIRVCLLDRRAAIDCDELERARTEALALCEAGRGVLAGIVFDAGASDAAVLARGMEKTLRHWRKALAHADRDRDDGEALHELRKAVKAHTAQLDLLRDFAPDGFAKRRAATDALGERLGELNDIEVMRRQLRSGALGLPEGIPVAAFDRLLKKHGRQLARKARDRAEKLLDDAPCELRRRLAKAVATREAA